MRIALLSILLACSSPSNHPSQPAAASELSPTLEPLAWWLGDWEGEHASEHWIAAAGAIYGVALDEKGRFEVMIVDDASGPGKPDGTLRLYAMPGGKPAVEFVKRDLGATSVTFANPAHDYPQSITYGRSGDKLDAVTAGANGENKETFAFRRIAHVAAPELEAADRAFSDDTGARGVDGWTAAFADDGAMLRKNVRVEGKPAIADAMRALLGSGKLAWAPLASGRRGDVGYTIGKATFTGTKPDDRWRSTYVSIWRKQADGSWKVWFDTGRPVND